MIGLCLPLGLSCSLLLLPIPWWCALTFFVCQVFFWPGKHVRAKCDHYLKLDGQFISGFNLPLYPGKGFWQSRRLSFVALAIILLVSLYAHQSMRSTLIINGETVVAIDQQMHEDLQESFALPKNGLEAMSQDGDVQQYEHTMVDDQTGDDKKASQADAANLKQWKQIRWTKQGSRTIGLE